MSFYSLPIPGLLTYVFLSYFLKYVFSHITILPKNIPSSPNTYGICPDTDRAICVLMPTYFLPSSSQILYPRMTNDFPNASQCFCLLPMSPGLLSTFLIQLKQASSTSWGLILTARYGPSHAEFPQHLLSSHPGYLGLALPHALVPGKELGP